MTRADGYLACDPVPTPMADNVDVPHEKDESVFALACRSGFLFINARRASANSRPGRPANNLGAGNRHRDDLLGGAGGDAKASHRRIHGLTISPGPGERNLPARDPAPVPPIQGIGGPRFSPAWGTTSNSCALARTPGRTVAAHARTGIRRHNQSTPACGSSHRERPGFAPSATQEKILLVT